jgi:hypothetical protein
MIGIGLWQLAKPLPHRLEGFRLLLFLLRILLTLLLSQRLHLLIVYFNFGAVLPSPE